MARGVKQKRPKSQPSDPDDSDLPAGLRDSPPGRRRYPGSKRWLEQVAAGTEKGIRDTRAWKNAVRQFGLKEARRRLRLGLLRSQCPEVNPLN